MKPIEVLKASVRLGASLVAALGLAFPAIAADRALLNIIGYSEDGDYFAFEEYGIQDGSGFAYSSVFVVDLANDTWVANAPFSARAEDEERTLGEIRLEALGKAQSTFDEYRIGVPPQILTMIGDGAATETGTRVHWSTPACCGPGFTQPDAQSLVLSTRGITSTEEYCKDLSPVGYVLTFQDQNGSRELHADGDVLPASRGCTLDYRIHAVVQPFENYWTDGFAGRRVAIIASYPFGFEGVDRRFLAVPIDR